MNPQESASVAEKDLTDEARRLEQVRQRAYELYDRRAGAPGDDVADWLEAERQIDAERPR